MKVYVPLTVAVWPEGDVWVSRVLELDIASFGDTPDDAADEAMDAVASYVNTLENLGDRERIFRERSIEVLDRPAEDMSVPLPRDLAERDRVQLRLFRLPVGEPHTLS